MQSRLIAITSTSLLAAACGPKGGTTTTDTTTTTGDTGGAPAAFPAYKDLRLFQQGAQWTFSAERTDSHFDSEDPAADANGMVVAKSNALVLCQVTLVEPFAQGVLSMIECDGELAAGITDPLAGAWAATDAGLWRIPIDMLAGGEVPELDPEWLFLPTAPAADHKETVLDPEVDHRMVRDVKQDGDAWCVEESWAAGDGAWRTLCIDAAGPLRGNGGWTGGMEQEVVFVRTEQ
jgi:hypothetical protein